MKTFCYMQSLALAIILFGPAIVAGANEGGRARDLGIPFDGQPGPLNAITDVIGVEVGQVTLTKGEGALRVGVGPVRTGVTVIHPRGKDSTEGVFAGIHTATPSQKTKHAGPLGTAQSLWSSRQMRHCSHTNSVAWPSGPHSHWDDWGQ